MFTPVVRRVIVAAIAGVTTIGLAAGPASAATKPVIRLAGSDRIGTSIAISTHEFPTAHAAKNVILTAAFTFADAMSAGPLGKQLDAPLLLTAPTSLSSATLTEIKRVMPTPSTTTGTTTSGCATTPPANAVYVIGGVAAIAASVNTTLNAAGFNVVRLAGTDRFGTSVAVAQCEGSPTTVFLATGEIFADALAAGPAAASKGGSVLLTAGSVLPSSVSTYLAGLTSPTVYAVGQPAHLADPSATPIVGGDRFATAALVATQFFPSPTVVGVATGANFPDALAGGAYMGRIGRPVLLTTPNTLYSATSLYIAQNHTTLTHAYLFGGTATLFPLVATQTSTVLNQS
ncbi:MAG TPA: cell wall-binding repeat-containing protein [Acidothermaceae bacterium]|nr:cell wall-binding repeat-containing protein [Acidothermaceae bacterium]